jgi:hypothetical protein
VIEVAHHSVESNSLPPKTNCWRMAHCCPAALLGGQHLCYVHQRKMVVLVFKMRETPTLIWVDNCSFSLLHAVFWWPIYTQWCWLAVPLILRGFFQTKQCKEEKIFFICTCAETGFRDSSLKGELPYILLGRLKACNTVATLWTVRGLLVVPCVQYGPLVMDATFIVVGWVGPVL